METNSKFIVIKNNGPEIESTNFWDTPLAQQGSIYVSVNARTIRLLVPPKSEDQIPEMKTGKKLIISRGPHPQMGRNDMFELLFDDRTQSPFVAYLAPGHFERLPNAEDVGSDFTATIWVQSSDGGNRCVLTLPCRYRTAPHLPWLKP